VAWTISVAIKTEQERAQTDLVVSQGTDSTIESTAIRLLDAAKEKKLVWRVIGACAIKLRCPKFEFLYDRMDRRITDIDLVTYSRYVGQTRSLLSEFGYFPDDKVNAFQPTRHLYYSKNLMVDVFIDRLEMCHNVDFRGRLELDNQTVPLADLMLCKLQNVHLNEKDVKDCIVLLREHEVSGGHADTIDPKHIARVLSQDWGFYHTFTENLIRIRDSLPMYDALGEADRRVIVAGLDKLSESIEGEPKSAKWRMRARVGTKKKWYTDVENLRM